MHALPVNNSGTARQLTTHTRYQSTQSMLHDRQPQPQLSYPLSSKHRTSGQDSGTYYGTCFQSSHEKFGKTTLSFHTAHSQLLNSVQKSSENRYRPQTDVLYSPSPDTTDNPATGAPSRGADGPPEPYKYIQRSSAKRAESARDLSSSHNKSRTSSAAKKRCQ